jgi:hypothetical protein
MAEELVLISKIKNENMLNELEKQKTHLPDTPQLSGLNNDHISKKEVQVGSQRNTDIESKKLTDVQTAIFKGSKFYVQKPISKLNFEKNTEKRSKSVKWINYQI